jgi:hypothetical protein
VLQSAHILYDKKKQIWLQNNIKSENLRHYRLVVPRNNETAMKPFNGFHDHNGERKLDFVMKCGPVKRKVVLHMSFNKSASLQGINKISKTSTK